MDFNLAGNCIASLNLQVILTILAHCTVSGLRGVASTLAKLVDYDWDSKVSKFYPLTMQTLLTMLADERG